MLNQSKASGDVTGENIMGELARDYLNERKSRRRWGIFFKLVTVAYVGIIIAGFYATRDNAVSKEHTALVELNGTIAPQGGVSADQTKQGLRQAFEATNSRAVILRINSPGGTPVQAAEINAEIIRLKGLYPDKPFYAVIADICASGGYFVAVAADTIYANPSSLVGSIGVLMDGYGFVGSMEKLGVERRLITAGESKGLLDPFSPLDASDVAHVEQMLDEVHQQFIDAVIAGRGDRLVEDDTIFSGLFWTGERALELGLVDGFGDAGHVARDVVGTEHVVDYTVRQSFLEQFAEQLGVTLLGKLGLKTPGMRPWMRIP
jgi:protease-4